MAYPKKMRERAIEALRKGHTKRAVNEMYGLGVNTLKSWEKLEEETGSLGNRPLVRKARNVDYDDLQKYCDANPFATHIEAGEFFDCSERVIRYAKKKLGITRKKRRSATRNEMSRNEKNSSKL